MATTEPFQPVLPFVGVLYVDESFRDGALTLAEDLFGPLDLRSTAIRFEYTRYYEAEMGDGIMRMWAGSREMADPANLADWKIGTDRIERELSSGGQRTVNLDPGFVGLSKVALASLKDHPQRIPVKDGVYAEIELIFKDGVWCALPWTYCDYADRPAEAFLTELRETLLLELRRRGMI